MIDAGARVMKKTPSSPVWVLIVYRRRGGIISDLSQDYRSGVVLAANETASGSPRCSAVRMLPLNLNVCFAVFASRSLDCCDLEQRVVMVKVLFNG